MRKARFTEHQIIAVLKSVEAGRTVKDVCVSRPVPANNYQYASFSAPGDTSNNDNAKQINATASP